MNYGYGAALNDGRFVVSWFGVPIVAFGDVAVTIPEWLDTLDAALGLDGKAYAAGQGNATGRAWLVCDDGRTLELGPTGGVSCCVVVPGVTCVYVSVVQPSGREVKTFEVDYATMMVIGQPSSVAIPLTSQGIADVVAGVPVLIDPIDRTVVGRAVRYVAPRGQFTIAQDWATGYPVISDGLTIGTLARGATNEPKLSRDRRYWIARSTAPTMLYGRVPDAIPAIVEAPLVIPSFSFSHPVLVAVFKDSEGKSGAPAEIVINRTKEDKTPAQAVKRPYFVAEDSVYGPFLGEQLGIYSEEKGDLSSVLKQAEKTQLLHGHDSYDPWQPPVTEYRPWDIPAIELYRPKKRNVETLAQTVDRWRREATSLLSRWAHDCAVIPQAYLMGPPEVWSEQEVLDALAYVPEIVNLSPRFKVVAPFSFLRGTIGISGRVGLTEALRRMITASPGLPILVQVGEIPTHPDPIPVPQPPILIPVPPPPPISEDPMPIKLPARCFVVSHISTVLAIQNGKLDIHQAVAYGAAQEVEITESKNSTPEDRRGLARMIAADAALRVDTILALQGKFNECLGLKPMADADVDSGWQNPRLTGPYLQFLGPDENGLKGILLTLTCVDKDGKLFR